MDDSYDNLRQWYLARLRKQAVEQQAYDAHLTPMSLVAADSEVVKQIIVDRMQRSNGNLVLPPDSTARTSKRNLDAACLQLAASTAAATAILLSTTAFFLLSDQASLLATGRLMLLVELLLLTFSPIGFYLLFKNHVLKGLAIVKEHASLELNGADGALVNCEFDDISAIDEFVTQLARAYSRSREREHAIADFSPHLICSLDREGKFIAAGEACNKLLGYSTEQLAGNFMAGYVLEADVPKALKSLHAAKQTDQSVEFDVRMVAAAATQRVWHALWSIDWSEAKGAFYCVVQDITQQKEMERLKREFLSMITHDLRSPITGIVLAAQFIGMEALCPLTPEAKERIESIETNGHHLLRLVNGLLEVERVETGHMQLNLEEVEVADIISDAVDTLRILAQEKSISIAASTHTAIIRADSQRLTQVLINLLSNAIKFSGRGSEIRLETAVLQESIEFRVIDHGRGIKPEDQEKVFDRFKQVQLSDATLKGGSGLGLAICKAIVEAHGGEIGVHSQPGKSSTFWFRICTACEKKTTAACPPTM